MKIKVKVFDLSQDKWIGCYIMPYPRSWDAHDYHQFEDDARFAAHCVFRALDNIEDADIVVSLIDDSGCESFVCDFSLGR